MTKTIIFIFFDKKDQRPNIRKIFKGQKHQTPNMKNFKVRKGPNRAYIYKNLFLFSIEFYCFNFYNFF